jgi:hypothetical protein
VVEEERVAEPPRAIELVIEPISSAQTVPAWPQPAGPDKDAPQPPEPQPPGPQLAEPEGFAPEPDVLEPVAVVSRPRSHGRPLSQGGQVSAPLMGQPPPIGDVLDAEIVDEPSVVPARASVNAAAAEVLSALTEVAFREARTDEWIMGPPEPVIEPTPDTLAAIRRGPATFPTDSWEAVDPPVPAYDDTYQGRRRAASSVRLWTVIGLVIAALGTAIAVPFILTSGDARPLADRTPFAPASSASGDVTVTSEPAASTDQTALPAVGASPLVTSSPPPPPPFQLTIQAEAGGISTAWGGTAGPPRSVAGATVIEEIGDDWDFGRGTDNWLEFRNITVPEPGKQYKVRIWYVFGLPPANGDRQMNVIVNGATTSTQTFPPTAELTSREVTITLGDGNNSIRFTHPFSRCPAIDRIEIRKA